MSYKSTPLQIGINNTRTVSQSIIYGGTTSNTLFGVPAFSTGGFTALAWVTPTANTNYAALVGSGTNSFGMWRSNIDGAIVAEKVGVGMILSSTASGGAPLNTQSFIAYSRSGTTGSFYLNGVASGSGTDSTDYSSASSTIGASSYLAAFTGPLRTALILGASSAAEISSAHQGNYPTWWFPSIPAGTQLITGDDSTFSSDTGFWMKTSATISGGAATIPIGGASLSRAMLVIGEHYRATVDITSLGGSTFSIDNGVSAYGTTTSTGLYTLDFVAATNTTFRISAGGSGGPAVLNAITLIPLGAVYFEDPSQPGSGNIVRSVGNVSGFSVRAASNRWSISSSQLERAEVETRYISSASRQGLLFSGSQMLSLATLGLGVYAGPWDIAFIADIPASAPSGSAHNIWQLSTANSSAMSCYLWEVEPALIIQVSAGYVKCSNFIAKYGGTRIRGLFRWDGTSVYLFVNGRQEVLTIHSEPVWTSVNFTHLALGTTYIGANNKFTGFLDAALVLGNLTTAEADQWNKTGILPARAYVAGGAGVALNTATITKELGSGTLSAASATGFTFANGGTLSIVRTNGEFTVRVGEQVRVAWDHTVNSGTYSDVVVGLRSTAGTWLSLTQAIGGTGRKEFTITATSASTTAHVVVSVVDTTNLTVASLDAKLLGVAFQLDPNQRGVGSVGYDISGAQRNLTLGSGVTWAIPSQFYTPLGNIVDVRSYGAKGDGVTDDYAALNACIAANYGKIIYFPVGTYLTSSPLTLSDSITLLGASLDSKLKRSGTGQVILSITGEQVKISTLYFDGNAKTGSDDGLIVVANTGDGAAIDNCYFIDSSTAGVKIWGATDVKVRDSYFTTCAVGVYANRNASGSIPFDRLLVDNNRFFGLDSGSGTGAIKCSSDSTTTVNVSITNNHIDSSGTEMGIELWGSAIYDSTVMGNQIKATSFGISFSGAIRCTATANDIVNCTSYGIEVASSSTDCVVSSNTINSTITLASDTSTAISHVSSSTKTSIIGNKIAGPATGILVQANEVIVMNNYITWRRYSGVSINNASYATISNNQFYADFTSSTDNNHIIAINYPDASLTHLAITGNTFNYTGKSSGGSNGISYYRGSTARTITNSVVARNSFLNCEANGGMFRAIGSSAFSDWSKSVFVDNNEVLNDTGEYWNSTRQFERKAYGLTYSASTQNVEVAGQETIVQVNATGGNTAVSLIGIVGTPWARCTFIKTDSSANTVTITPSSGTINGAANYVLSAQWKRVTVRRDYACTNWLIIESN